MADIFAPKKRSEIMSRIRSSGTTPEETLFQLLREILGKRRVIERNVRTLPGQPDFMIPSLCLVIFVDGCFYHGCPEHGHFPKTNRKYWTPKLARNLARDKANRRLLRRMGFSVWTIWEHSLKGKSMNRVQERLIPRLHRRINLARRAGREIKL